MSTTSQTQ